MPTSHPYDQPALERVFAASPHHPIAAVSVVDENHELRDRLIAEGVLVPAADVAHHGVATRQAAVQVDLEAFFASAREIVRSQSNAEARAVADSPDSDPRLVTALRSILALSPHMRASRRHQLGRS